ncbi:MAG: LPS-assembly protein LptD, partial [Treponema sp.]|nr:LPS-assembly protein LptD [Treponema sp.]
VVNEDYARLKGDVIISLKDGNAVHRIKAWEILYNRTRNVLTASGNVEYVKEDGDTVETFKGESITVNLDNWSSIFMDGVSERSISGNATAYRFAGTVISRNSEEVTVLTGADITNPANEEAYWSLHASKLWLLPGNDFAFLNAILKVGNVPVLYVPFFYYPADEIVFHPVLGYRSREGTFLQTTTYILGRPQTEAVSENSITKIFGNASQNMEKKREGVFLRTTGAKTVSPNDTRLSVLFDAYVNLGAYLGTELALPKKGILGDMTLSAGLGLTRNVYPIGDINTPFPRYNGVSEWNQGQFFSYTIPFRYRMKYDGSFQIPNGTFTWSLPYYSDPYVDRDFMRRSEVLDWLSMLREGATSGTEDPTDLSSYELSTYEWRLSGSYSPSVSFLSPYVSSFSVSSIYSSLLFGSQISNKYSIAPSDPLALPSPTGIPNPGYKFFFPNLFTVYSVSLSVSGTPYTSGSSAGSTASSPAGGPAPGDSLLPALPRSPWDDTENSSTDQSSTDSNNPDSTGQGGYPQDTYTLSPPVLSQRFTLPVSAGGPQFSINYRLNPTSASEMQFRTTAWQEQDDINWSELSSVLAKFRTDGSVGFTVSQAQTGLYTSTMNFSGTGSWQDYTYMNNEAEDFNTDAKRTTAQNRADGETYITTNWANTTTIKPFYQSSIWSNTNFQYNLQGLLAKNSVDSTGARDWVYGSWDKTNITNHQVSANVAANVMDYNQNLSISTVLPPRDPSASGNATFRAWITETSLRGSVQQPWDESLRSWDPVYLTETFTFGTVGNFQQYVVFDPEQKQYTTLTSSLSLSGFTGSYSMVYAKPYRFNPLYGSAGSGSQALWLLQDKERLEPRQLQLGYVKTFTQSNLFGQRLSFSININTGLTFDLQRYTNSSLTFGLGVTVGIANFLDLSFSTNSENSVVYRYFQFLPFFDTPPTNLYSGYETNMFMDLFNSFRFDNDELRKNTGFKLKSINVSLVHHLGDWNAKLSLTMTPYLNTASFPYSYKFSNEVSFLIQWVPITEIKSEIDYSQEKLTIK